MRPAHREYNTRLCADGRLVAYGPFVDGGGTLFIYEADSLAVAQEILAADPYQISGIFESCRLGSWDIVRANPALLTAAPYVPKGRLAGVKGTLTLAGCTSEAHKSVRMPCLSTVDVQGASQLAITA
jgi:uncharacterized protein YciI